MNPQQIERLSAVLKNIELHDSAWVEAYSGTPPNHPVIYLDGDFTVDELRQIVAACDAAMGKQVEVAKECRTWHDNGQCIIRTRINYSGRCNQLRTYK